MDRLESGDKAMKNETTIKITVAVQSNDDRTVNFEADVPVYDLRSWFERTGMALRMIYDSNGAVIVRITEPGPQKINSIKTLRAATSLGLKEAKDIVEGAANVRFADVERAKRMIAELAVMNCTGEIGLYDDKRLIDALSPL